MASIVTTKNTNNNNSDNNNDHVNKKNNQQIDNSFLPSSFLIPSQVVVKSTNNNKNKKKSNSNKKKYYKKKKYVKQKPKANVWVYIPEDHLRAHPLYKRLPIVESIIKLNSYNELSLFRQSSLQWDLMHNGRLTTSRAAGATGMLEKKFARKLGIPDSLSGNGKARQSYFHLRETPAFVNIQEAEKVLILTKDIDHKFILEKDDEYISSLQENLWTTTTNNNSSKKYPYNYMSKNSNKHNKSNVYNKYNRMAYGNIQEPTAILVALNHFHRYNYTIYESGMYSGEALLEKYKNDVMKKRNDKNKLPNSNYSDMKIKQLVLLEELLNLGCRIGASPDGIVIHNKNKNDVQALEVKNHLNLTKQAYASFESMSTWYIVQLQLEMFCIGPNCNIATLVRLSSTRGAVIFKMKRDDEYILMMLQRFKTFYSKYVLTKTAPPPNFDQDDELLQRFVGKTKDISKSKTSIVRRLWPNQIQRSPYYYQ